VEGDGAHNALFGTYQWNDQETDATLVTTGLRDGTLWGDTILQYNTNEPFVADLLKGDPDTSEETLLEDQAARNYAIPSKERCIQCHEGSASQSFVLGFLPVQVSRRRTGEGGTYEPAGPDELTQLQRLIDYGVITGIESPSDVLPLEQLEGSRTPRNDYELQAQAYTLGNCSHCHNPRGYPSIQNPVLKTVFNLLPGPDGGLFQFPLEKYSPRIFRGNGGTTQMPYITPSLMDYPRFDPLNTSTLVSDFVVLTASTSPPAAAVLYAPWRSLMYRNVDTAFSYVDDEALFPHMPRNTPGYDNRVPRILSDWMVSIPSVLKHPEQNEYAFIDTWDGQPATFQEPNTDEQPYVEVLPGDPRYASAVAAANGRLEILHTGVNPQLDVPRDDRGNPTEALTPRYQQDRNTGDIIDPATLADPICNPVPTGRLCGPGSVSTVCDPPDHPNWTRLDETNPEVYATRRVDWVEKLAEQQPDNVSGCGGASQPANVSAHQDEEDAVSLLQTVSLAPFRSYATTAVPYGFWQVQAGCDYSGEKTAASLVSTSSGDTRWLNNPATHTPPSAPVYFQTPGAAVFKSICINCHGALADGSGRLADNLAEMTGGQARPADFRDGLFGPVGAAPDANNRHAVFGAGVPTTTPDWYSLDGVTLDDDDRASRYMAWMALGGTQVLIPPPILQIVSLTRVLGTRRPYFAAAQPSANMLSTAKLLCETLLGNSKTPEPNFDPEGVYSEYIDGNAEFIGTNHDGQTWFDMCRQGHPSPVHVMHLSSSCTSHLCEPSAFINGALSVSRSLIDPGSYPPGTPVGDPDGATGTASSLTADNAFPWCVQPLDYLSGQQALDYISAQGWPLCPQNVTYWTTADASRWATRGAINAGLAVFLYLDGLEKKSAPDADYDECPTTGTMGDP
jgi:mono/diheme cytochrome c family protein